MVSGFKDRIPSGCETKSNLKTSWLKEAHSRGSEYLGVGPKLKPYNLPLVDRMIFHY